MTQNDPLFFQGRFYPTALAASVSGSMVFSDRLSVFHPVRVTEMVQEHLDGNNSNLAQSLWRRMNS